jgi:hypothetical protein
MANLQSQLVTYCTPNVDMVLTVFVFDHLEPAAKNVIDIHWFWMTRVSHAMIADEDDVDDIHKVASFQQIVQIPGEHVNAF